MLTKKMRLRLRYSVGKNPHHFTCFRCILFTQIIFYMTIYVYYYMLRIQKHMCLPVVRYSYVDRLSLGWKKRFWNLLSLWRNGRSSYPPARMDRREMSHTSKFYTISHNINEMLRSLDRGSTCSTYSSKNDHDS